MNYSTRAKAVSCSLIFAMALLWTCRPMKALAKYERSNSVDVGRENPFEKILRKSDVAPKNPADASHLDEQMPELFLESITLKFLDAEKLKPTIEKMVSDYGSVTTDTKSNSLVLCDTREGITKILTEIRKADKRPQQIMIEVVIIDVQLNDDAEMGINWDLLSDNTYDIGYRQNFTTSRLRSTIEDADTIGNATAFNTVGLGGEFSVISGTVRNVIHMIQQKRDVEIIASPRAMMVSGQSATIKAVEEIPYTEVSDTAMGGAMALTSTEFKEVGVNLQVTATVTDDNDIFLTVDAEQNVKTSESETGVPVVNTRKADTSLLLRDGQIVVMGGLRRQEKTKEIYQIPILSDLPVIGWLFKSTRTVLNNSELIVLLSPHLHKAEPIPDEAMSKFRQIKDRPMLSLPEDAEAEQHRQQLERRAKEQTNAIEQLKEEIAEYEQAENELKKYRDSLQLRITGHTLNNKQLGQKILECEQAENELTKYRDELEQRLKEQTASNKQLQMQIGRGKQREDELKHQYQQVQKSLKEEAATVEQLQAKIVERENAARKAAKEMLLEKIRALQGRKDRSATKELLSALASLDEILSKEIQECLHASERTSADV
jgi:Flp pilus assembly secretin CpaC